MTLLIGIPMVQMEPVPASDDDAAKRCVYIMHVCDYPRQIASVSDRKICAGLQGYGGGQTFSRSARSEPPGRPRSGSHSGGRGRVSRHQRCQGPCG